MNACKVQEEHEFKNIWNKLTALQFKDCIHFFTCCLVFGIYLAPKPSYLKIYFLRIQWLPLSHYILYANRVEFASSYDEQRLICLTPRYCPTLINNLLFSHGNHYVLFLCWCFLKTIAI